MASFRDLELDWSLLNLECTHSAGEDLQLAAELGKTLLERNKELENSLKQHQVVIDDQAQEIEYLTKQNVALREVNESRLRIYEQLEVSIQDLERANHRLLLENSTGKKQIKSLKVTIENLETKCEDFQTTADDLRFQLDVLKNRLQRPQQDSDKTPSKDFNTNSRHDDEDSPANHIQASKCVSTTTRKTETKAHMEPEPERFDEAEMIRLQTQLEQSRAQCRIDSMKITELEEQLASLANENCSLEKQLTQIHVNNDAMKSMHEELTTLDEVRQGHLCSRCLRNVEPNDQIPDDDDSSMLEALQTPQHRTSFTLTIQEENHSSPVINQSDNLYKNLAAKYEALLEVQSQSIKTNKQEPLSLQDEMQMSGDFNTMSTKDTDEESGHGDSLRPEKPHKITRKTFSHTPTDFSEAETSSSGFADETSNKFTQTEGRVGSFLCTIADGDDCKFSIYDDASPVNSRFIKHREVVDQLLTAMKKAVEDKDNAVKLPTLEELTTHTKTAAAKITPMLPQIVDLLPDDDGQSVLSSSMSELSMSQNEPTTVIENIIQSQSEPIPEPEQTPTKPEMSLRPLVRQPLENLSPDLGKRSSSRRRKKQADRSDSPHTTQIIGSPKINYSKRPNSGRLRRNQCKVTCEDVPSWNGNTVEYWSRKNVASPTPSQGSAKSYLEFKPSSASQDLNKLKQLERSYAEVVRLPIMKNEQYKQRRK